MAEGKTLSPIEGWLATLLAYVVAYRRQTNPRALAIHTENLLATAAPVFKELGSSRRAQLKAIDLIEGGKTNRTGMPSPAYATALEEIYAEMKGTKEDRDAYNKYMTSHHVDEKYRTIATALMGMLRPDSATVEKKDEALDKLITIIPDKVLKLAMVPDTVERQDTHLGELKHLVNRFVKRNDTHLTANEKKTIKARDPERLKRYDELKKKVRLSWESFIRGMIRENNGKPVKVIDARKELDANGVKHHPEIDSNGMEKLRIGENGNFYTMDGTELMMKPASNLTIKFNPKWDYKTDNTYVLKFRSPFSGHHEKRGELWTAVRSVKFNTDNRTNNYQDVLDAIPHVPGSQAIWLKDLHGNDLTRRIHGAMTEIQYHFAARIGTIGNSTVGLSTLTLDHVTINDGSVILKYIGKDSKPQRHLLKAGVDDDMDACIAVIKKLVRGKSRKDYLWTDAQGKHITPTNANAYLRGRCKFPLTGEKFRNVRGTELMQNMLTEAKIPKNASQADVANRVKKMALSVGELLGHVRTNKEGNLENTANTAIKSYIVPTLIHDFFKARGLQTPKWVPKEGR